jgi:hypothetical protein
MKSSFLVAGRVVAVVALGVALGAGCGKSAGPPKTDGPATDGGRDGDAGERPDGDGSTCRPGDVKKAMGETCACGAECVSGFCNPEGVCCNEACTSGCETCKAAETVGTCVNLPAGSRPRAGQEYTCPSADATTCGLDGFCDGAGACRKHVSGTMCRGGSCSPAGSVINSSACNGNGQCVPGPEKVCFPFACNAANGQCYDECSSNSMCVSGRTCVSGSCGKKPRGAQCDNGVECASGFCANKVCCNTACNGACVACNLPQREGTCFPIDNDKPDPNSICRDEGATSCGRTGLCDGVGGCSKYMRDTQCLAASCSGNRLNTPGTCDGIGTCRPPGVQNCAPFRCVNGACTRSCATHADCDTGIACVSGSCGKKLDGQVCAAPSECQSNQCVDGVCCESACTGPCRSCALPTSPGHCMHIAGGSPDPRNMCTDQTASSCGTNGRCDGTGACQKYAVGTQCRNEACSGNVYTPPSLCNSSGQCVAPDSQPCSPYVCNGTKCFDICTQNAHCLTPNVCQNNSCGLKPNGAACETGVECRSTICAQGFCCDNTCTGACRSCALGATRGTCTLVATNTVDPAGVCVDTGMMGCGTNGRCQAGACQLYASGTACRDSTCPASSAMFTGTSTCNGSGMCLTPAATSCFPYGCGVGVCKAACTTNADCTAPAVCIDGSCGLKPNGGACSNPNECISNFCQHGFCCETSCTGPCKSCGLENSRGSCRNVANGAADPQQTCSDMGAASCRTDGFCDGNGACRLYAAGTTCQPPSCPTAQSTLVSGRSCNGLGVCQAATTIACAPYVCNGTTACKAACTGDGDCLPPNICDPQTNLCGDKRRLGQSCTATSECLTGNTCVDGVCCSSPSCGLCQACNVSGSAGNCANVASGISEPHGLCTANPPCGNTGACNGAGACQQASTTVACGNATCSGSTFTPVSHCNGTGTCAAQTASSCSPYVCGTNACKSTPCGSDADCLAPFTCQGTGTNRNCARKPNGMGCGVDSECISGFCTNGVCCGSDTCPTCQACNLNGAGSCSPIPNGAAAPTGQCPVAGPCGNTGSCNGAGACAQSATSVMCSAATCTGSTFTAAGFCSGSGNPCPSVASGSCSPYLCASATACRTNCTTNAHCVNDTFYCNGSGMCVAKQNNGTACGGPDQCGSGFCVDGVCCGTGSCATCQACNIAGSAGTCANVGTGSTEPHGRCPVSTTCGNTGTCNGSGACTQAPSSTQCGSAACVGSTFTPAVFCSGSGTCPSPTTTNCGVYTCNTNNTCRTVCQTSADCANQTTHYCTGAGGSCVTKKGLGIACGGDGECGSGQCTDGVCCMTNACGQCQRCNVASNPGTCTNLPAGTTAPAGQCAASPPCGNTGTCNGSGGCTLGSGQCAPASCNGTTFTAAASCSGGSCPAGATSSCGNYVCAATSCRTSCNTDDDCANQTTLYCTGVGGDCVGKKASGAACGLGHECTSGNCVDGVCCNSNSCPTCQACNVSGNGTCANVANNISEPHGRCPATTTCGNTGTCNGAGACRQAPTSVQCGNASCAGTTATLATFCSGTGSCSPAATDDCFPYICGGTTCRVTCSSNNDCANTTTHYCTGTNGSCLPKKSLGESCGGDGECGTGNCVDNVCCSTSACAGCRACNVSGSEGNCAVVPNGTPEPHGLCPVSSVCGNTGTCNGGACQQTPSGTVCGSSSCSGNLFTRPATCSGAGTCAPGTVDNCGFFACTMGGCRTTCNSDGDCQSNGYCSGPGGSCLEKRMAGMVCVSDNQCQTGNCTDNVCCGSASCPSCQSCAVTGFEGTCANLPDGTLDLTGTCTNQGAPSCGTNGRCNGSGGCALYDAGTLCASMCQAGGTLYSTTYCDGLGTCGPLSLLETCLSLTCDETMGGCL